MPMGRGALPGAGGSTTSRLGRGLFVAAVVLLIALGVWWIVLLDRALNTEHQLLRQSLVDAAAVHAARLRASRTMPPPGPFADDARFVVHHGAPAPDDVGAPIEPPLRLLATRATTADLEAHYARKRLMLAGEGVLLCSLLLAVVAMLYRLFRAERRFHEEMEGFLSRVTHEMKTPLAGIKAVLQTIESGRMPPERLVELAGRALRSVEREEALVQNLLLAQRLRSGAALAAEAVDLAGLLRAQVETRVDIPAAPVRFELTIAQGCRSACGDLAAIRSILDNLLDNATKYGGGTVTIAARCEGDRVVVEIADDGIGFAPGRAESLFLPFVREAGGAGTRRGTGLGLWIARGLARGMGGDLHAESAGEGQGATFRLALPLAPEGAIA